MARNNRTSISRLRNAAGKLVAKGKKRARTVKSRGSRSRSSM